MQINESLYRYVTQYLSDLTKDLEIGSVHWASGDDESICWCHSCCRFKVRHLRRHDRKHSEDYYMSGGCGSTEDSPAFCAGCGKPLYYSLSEYGVEEELNHFETYGFLDEQGVLHPVTAHELLELLESAESTATETKEAFKRFNGLLEQLRDHITGYAETDARVSFGLKAA